MMRRQQGVQRKLFYTNINLDKRIRKNHILRKITERIDFDFVYQEVKDKYGKNGNVSVPPPVILKMMVLLILYNVRSERELMDTIPERLDWLWFLNYDLDDEIPNHSVLSKARSRWGIDAFKTFFERIVWQCVEAGLVDGSKLFMDSSLIQANASNNSVVNKDSLKRYLNKGYQVLESRLDKNEESSDNADQRKNGSANKKYMSTTDPDASVTRQGKGESKLQYQIHRGVEGKNEIITATDVTPGSVNEAHRFSALIDQHQETTMQEVEVVVADSKYGTVGNYLNSKDRNIKAHIPSLEETQRGSGRQKDIFPKELFTYNPDDDTFICPAGNILKRRNYNRKRETYEYKAFSKVCSSCKLRKKCTRAKNGRSLKRHIRQDDLDTMYKQARSLEAKRDIKTRKHYMERTFARSTRYGFKRARWRRLWRVQIQEYLTSTIQNMMILLKDTKKPNRAVEMIAKRLRDTVADTRYQKLLTDVFLKIIFVINKFTGKYLSGTFDSFFRFLNFGFEQQP